MLSGPVLAGCSMAITGCYLVAYKRYFVEYPTLLYLGIVEAAALAWYLLIGWGLDRGVPVALPPGIGVPGLLLLVGVVAATVGAAIASVRALQSGDVSYVAPLTQLAPPVVLGVEVALLDLAVSPLQVAGLALATAGVYVLNRDGPGLLEPFVRVVRLRPARLALLSAGLIGLADVGRRVLLSTVALPPRTLVAVTLAGLTLGTLPFGIRRWDARPTGGRAWAGLAVAGFALAAGDHLTALALVVSPASVVVPILSGRAVVAVILGGELLGEPDVGRRSLAAVVTAVGIALVAVT
jgi:drug/metabolite transporter (DMT)-like permease